MDIVIWYLNQIITISPLDLLNITYFIIDNFKI